MYVCTPLAVNFKRELKTEFCINHCIAQNSFCKKHTLNNKAVMYHPQDRLYTCMSKYLYLLQ